MRKHARHWLKYLNREGLVLLLRDMSSESDTVKGILADTEKTLSDIKQRNGPNAAEAAGDEEEAGTQPVIIEEIYGWRPEIDAFGPDEEWNGQVTDPSKAVTASPDEEHAG